MIVKVGQNSARAVILVLAILLAWTLIPAGTAEAKSRPVVPEELFGIHYHSIISNAPDIPVGGVRLWDSGVAWAKLNPEPGVYDWGRMDAAVANAESAGAREIQYVFGVTPAWAAERPDLASAYGAGASSPPSSIAHFTTFAAAVAGRYRGRITSYEIWNEGSLKMYFAGTSKQLADMTIKGSRAIKAADPRALVVAPSSTYGVFTRRPKFWKDFAKRLKKARWPIDAVNIHPYSKSPDYLAKREKTIRKARSFYRRYKFKGPIWDTEINYGDRRNMFQGFKQISYDGETAAGMVARTYIDAMRLGVPRVFWYGWDYHLFGIDMIDPGTSERTTAGDAFIEIQDWMVGQRWYGCTTKNKVRTCRLRGPDGTWSRIMYSTGTSRTRTLPAKATAVRRLDGTVQPISGKTRLRLTKVPVLIVGA